MDVLVVEDEALIRAVVSAELTDDGLSVAEAPCAETALALTESEGAPGVVVTDVNLGPGMNGLALVEEVHRRWPDAGVVVVTGDPANLRDRILDPRERCLVKPVSPATVVTTVRELMRRSPR